MGERKKKKEERFFPRSFLLPLRFSRERKRKAKTEKPGKRKTRPITRPIGTRLNTYYIIFRSLENPRVPARLTFFFFLFIYFHTEVRKAIRSMNLLSTFVCVCVYAYVCGFYNYFPFCFSLCFLLLHLFLFTLVVVLLLLLLSFSVFYSCSFVFVPFFFFFSFFYSFVCLLPRVPPATS